MIWTYNTRTCRECTIDGVTYMAQRANRKASSLWDIFEFSLKIDGNTIAEDLTTRQVTAWKPGK